MERVSSDSQYMLFIYNFWSVSVNSLWITRDGADIVIDGLPIRKAMEYNAGESRFEAYFTPTRPADSVIDYMVSAQGFSEGRLKAERFTSDDALSGRFIEGTRTSVNETGTLHGNWAADGCRYNYHLYLKGPITGDVTLHLTGNEYCVLFWEQEEVLISIGDVEATRAMPMELDAYYFVNIAWRFTTGSYNMDLKYSYTGQETPISIPDTNFGHSYDIGTGTIFKKVAWPSGQSDYTFNGIIYWHVSCGDGLVHSSEEWDDGNTNDDDGWSSQWKIEEGSYWSGGSLTSRDTWIKCHDSGKSPSDTGCVEVCGDKVVGPNEQCEDGNDSSGKLLPS